MATKYKALTGINYPTKGGAEIRVEAGEIHEFPKAVAVVLLADGAIEGVQ
jgi:hypothetical protein